MNLPSAVSRIQRSFTKMNEAYQRPVFDEIAIVGLSGGAVKLHHYEGPRQAQFLQEYGDKTIPLRRELTEGKAESGGEFGFTREGEGDLFDAYICLGPQLYLFCNNTGKSMHEITQDPRWLAAQQQFLHASQHFAQDPMEI